MSIPRDRHASRIVQEDGTSTGRPSIITSTIAGAGG
jgi:hypothetical protein